MRTGSERERRDAERPVATRLRRDVVRRRPCRRGRFGFGRGPAGHRDQRRSQDAGRRLRCRVHSSDDRFASGRADLARRVRAAARRCATSASALPPKAIRCSCPIRSIGSAKAPVIAGSVVVQLPEPGRHGQAAAADGVDQRAGRGREGRARPSSRSSTRSRRSTRPRRSARRATAWAARSSSGPPPRCPIASAPARRSTAAAWSPTSPTVRICSHRRSRRGCISASRRTTTRASRTRRTSCGRRSRRPRCRRRSKSIRGAARLVHAGHAVSQRQADLQQAGRREGLGQAGRLLYKTASRRGTLFLCVRSAGLCVPACEP